MCLAKNTKRRFLRILLKFLTPEAAWMRRAMVVHCRFFVAYIPLGTMDRFIHENFD
jgi:hypothetical protein